MAAFWLVLAVALCGLYFTVYGETINGNSDKELGQTKPGMQLETGDQPIDNPSGTKSTTDPSTTSGSTTGSTKPPTVNGTTYGTTIPPTTGTEPPTNVTSPTTGTEPPVNMTIPPANGTEPPTNETKPPTAGMTPPPAGTNPSNNPGQPAQIQLPGWLFPGLLGPPMPVSSSSSMDIFDHQLSGNEIIQFFCHNN
ncbi:hypothetical protein V9T40_005127 [Parthenolecanium corni]|uniref:Uncharacterized protein n=1 Tax=Parthenolecanium corni TaxID=536013 RepID=A0AAN9Y2K3_9HEMI